MLHGSTSSNTEVWYLYEKISVMNKCVSIGGNTKHPNHFTVILYFHCSEIITITTLILWRVLFFSKVYSCRPFFKFPHQQLLMFSILQDLKRQEYFTSTSSGVWRTVYRLHKKPTTSTQCYILLKSSYRTWVLYYIQASVNLSTFGKPFFKT